MAEEETKSKAGSEDTCVCPFCDAVIEVAAPWCETCQVEVQYCSVCEEPLPQGAAECPACGALGEK
jgi:hypothetical protein